MPIVMSLCPNCQTIQKDGTICGICTYPVGSNLPCRLPVKKLTGEDFELESRRHKARLNQILTEEV